MGGRSLSSRRLLYHLYHQLWLGLDLLLPPSCGGCGALGYRWCPACQATIQAPPPPLCDACGMPVPPTQPLCATCREARPSFRQLRSWSMFDGSIRKAMHGLKYRRNIGLGEALTPHLSAFAGSLAWNVDILVPVPLGRSRKNERGYNQAGLIGWPLALALGVRFVPGSLGRTRDTPTQVGLNKQQRRENVHSAFRAEPPLVRGRRVLLVDDVATTGATLSSCAEALLAAGARDVFALTVARAQHGLSRDA